MSKCATRSNAVRRVREMRAGNAWYRGGSFLAAKRIYATALLLRAGRAASRSVVRGVFALNDALHCRRGVKWSNYGLDTIATLFGTVSESCGVLKLGPSRISQKLVQL